MFGIITRSILLLPAVGDKPTAPDEVDGVTAVIAGGDVTGVGGATAVGLGTTDVTALAGMICGSVITRLCDNVVMVSAGLMAVWLTGVALGTC